MIGKRRHLIMHTMNTILKHLVLLPLLLGATQALAEEEEEKTITYRIKGEEVTIKESENPELAKFINQIKAAAEKQKAEEEAKNKPPEPEPVAAAPPKPEIKTTPQKAEELYNRGDFESAYEHYKALSAEGDDEASLMLAIMHSKGQGVEEDEAAAHAWFTRSAEQGNNSAHEFIKESRLTDNEKQKSLEVYNEIAKEFDEPEKAERADEQFMDIQRTSHATSRPETVGRTDQSSLKVKTYRRT
ncbi:MAG: hypothetical protein R3318_01970, partial [Gammaproteobacteria bacterium]|nr:hypothetical protein [Gammaproteobacteria bacterium]